MRSFFALEAWSEERNWIKGDKEDDDNDGDDDAAWLVWRGQNIASLENK